MYIGHVMALGVATCGNNKKFCEDGQGDGVIVVLVWWKFGGAGVILEVSSWCSFGCGDDCALWE